MKSSTLLLNQLKNKKDLVVCFYDPIDKTYFHIQEPDQHLTNIPKKTVAQPSDFDDIPKTGGCYWILTNEDVNHCLNSSTKHPEELIPDTDDCRVVYNGVADDLRSRAKQHLLRNDRDGHFGTRSGISVDLMKGAKTETKNSHAKRINLIRLRTADGFEPMKTSDKNTILERLNFTREEVDLAFQQEEIFFKNGIDVQDLKHQHCQWIFAYESIDNQLLRDHIERSWREKYGIPILCTYKSAR